METLQGSAPDRTVVDVTIEEQSTGELSFGAGFSTGEGPLGDISIRERNLLGRGQDLKLAFTISGRRQQLDFSFTEPYFLDRNLSAGIDAYNTRVERDESSFSEKSLGGAIRFGWEWAEFLRQSVRYNISSDDIFDVESNASPGIKQQEGETLSSVVGQEISYDRRDNRLNPTEGYVVRLRNDVAGLGGDLHYLRTRLSAAYYYPITDSVTIGVDGEAGYIFGFGGEDIRITDAFFLGGATLRGFETAGVGPRDVSTKDSLGGNKYARGSVEVQFPLGLPEEYGIKGRLFSDFGTLFDTDLTTATVPFLVDKHSIRVSAGFGVTWTSPFGPLAVDFALPILVGGLRSPRVFQIQRRNEILGYETNQTERYDGYPGNGDSCCRMAHPHNGCSCTGSFPLEGRRPGFRVHLQEIQGRRRPAGHCQEQARRNWMKRQRRPARSSARLNRRSKKTARSCRRKSARPSRTSSWAT